MRRYILLLLPFLSFLIFSCSGNITDRDRTGLKGKVKSFKEIRCDPTYVDDQWVAGEPLTNDYRMVYFDKNGNFIESYSIGTMGDTVGKSVCKRENGKLVEEVFYTRFWLTPKESRMYPTSRTVLDQVADDQINYEVWKGDERLNEGANYYDDQGHLIRQVQVVNEKEINTYYTYKKNLLIETYQEDMNGQRTATRLYDYGKIDKHGNWTTQFIYDDEDKIVPTVALNRELDYY